MMFPIPFELLPRSDHLPKHDPVCCAALQPQRHAHADDAIDRSLAALGEQIDWLEPLVAYPVSVADATVP